MIRNGTRSAQRSGATSRRSSAQEAGDNQNPMMSRMNECVQDNPTTALMVGFGVGFGAGLLLTLAFQESSRYFQRGESYASYAERLGQRVMDSLKDAVPSSWRG